VIATAPPAQSSDQLGARRGEPARRRVGGRAPRRRRAAADRARRLGYYIANGRRHAIDVDVDVDVTFTFKKPRATAY
jgi:hypothetical protein